jgi:hypothetical protein
MLPTFKMSNAVAPNRRIAFKLSYPCVLWNSWTHLAKIISLNPVANTNFVFDLFDDTLAVVNMPLGDTKVDIATGQPWAASLFGVSRVRKMLFSFPPKTFALFPKWRISLLRPFTHACETCHNVFWDVITWLLPSQWVWYLTNFTNLT